MRRKILAMSIVFCMLLGMVPVVLANELTDALGISEEEVAMYISEDTVLKEDVDGLVLVTDPVTVTIDGAKLSTGLVVAPNAAADKITSNTPASTPAGDDDGDDYYEEDNSSSNDSNGNDSHVSTETWPKPITPEENGDVKIGKNIKAIIRSAPTGSWGQDGNTAPETTSEPSMTVTQLENGEYQVKFTGVSSDQYPPDGDETLPEELGTEDETVTEPKNEDETLSKDRTPAEEPATSEPEPSAGDEGIVVDTVDDIASTSDELEAAS